MPRSVVTPITRERKPHTSSNAGPQHNHICQTSPTHFPCMSSMHLPIRRHGNNRRSTTWSPSGSITMISHNDARNSMPWTNGEAPSHAVTTTRFNGRDAHHAQNARQAATSSRMRDCLSTSRLTLGVESANCCAYAHHANTVAHARHAMVAIFKLLMVAVASNQASMSLTSP